MRYIHDASLLLTAENGRTPLLTLIIPLGNEYESVQKSLLLLSATHRGLPADLCLKYKNQTFKSFRQSLLLISDSAKLTVIFLLLLNDIVDTGHSAWRVHLAAVKAIVQRQSLRDMNDELQRTLMFKFFWWDTLGSLLSMQEPVLPAEWLEEMSAKWEPPEFISCSKETFLVMNQMARGSRYSQDELEALPLSDVALLSKITTGSVQERLIVESIWKQALTVWAFLSVSPYPGPRETFEVHVRQIFAETMTLKSGSHCFQQVLFPLLVGGSCTTDVDRQDFVRKYCTQCFKETRFGFYNFGLSILKASWRLRETEGQQRRAIGGSPYSCWRNLTSTKESSFAIVT